MIIFIKTTRRNNSLHPGYLTSLVTRTNHNTIQAIGIYVRVFRTADHAGQIFIPHRLGLPPEILKVRAYGQGTGAGCEKSARPTRPTSTSAMTTTTPVRPPCICNSNNDEYKSSQAKCHLFQDTAD